MDDNDRPHYHVYNNYGAGSVDLNFLCTNDNCTADHVVVIPLDEYRTLYKRARNRHPANQQRDPDPASRANDCICEYSTFRRAPRGGCSAHPFIDDGW